MDAYGNYTAGLSPAPTTSSGLRTSRVYCGDGVPGTDFTVPDGYDLALNSLTGDLYSLSAGVWAMVPV